MARNDEDDEDDEKQHCHKDQEIDNDQNSITVKDDIDRWKNRRRMAWVSLISILFVTSLMIFYVSDSKAKNLENVITWFYFSMASITGMYMGAATYADIKGAIK